MENIEQQLTSLHTPNMDLSHQYEAALEAWQSFADLAGQVLDDLLQKVCEFLEAIREAVNKILVPWVRFVFEQTQRAKFYADLRRWRVPHWLAKPVSGRWPAAWLPHLC